MMQSIINIAFDFCHIHTPKVPIKTRPNYLDFLNNSLECGTVSNALAKSVYKTAICPPSLTSI